MKNYAKHCFKLCFETKSTKLGVGHFTSISGHFFANYINSFHKTEVLSSDGHFEGPNMAKS
jgi:hypothetical protein